jgi:peroxiredoxin
MNSTALAALGDAFMRCRDMDASLADRLDAYSSAVRNFLPSYATAVDKLILNLMTSDAGANAPKPGQIMPSFLLPDENGHLVSLEGLLEKGPVAITFHRGHWCPWCRISLKTLVEAQGRIRATGAHVAAIMPERQKFAAAFKDEAASPFPVLTDMDNAYALELNLAIWIGPDLERLLSSFGRDLPHYQANDSWMLPIPATFVVGSDGLVKARFIDPDFRRRATIEELIQALTKAS